MPCYFVWFDSKPLPEVLKAGGDSNFKRPWECPVVQCERSAPTCLQCINEARDSSAYANLQRAAWYAFVERNQHGLDSIPTFDQFAKSEL